MSQSSSSLEARQPWWKLLNGYHWFVLIVASAAWFFDCLDQRLFSLARVPALASLMKLPPSDPTLQGFGKVVTACFLIGWGVGGLIFGSLGDKYGRAKMLTLTILIYSACTGLSYFSQTRLDFTVFRFLTGVGVGGVFGLAVALIAETVPDGARAQSLGLLQILSTIGNIAAGFAKMGIDALEANKTIAAGEGWRWMFLIGALPAFMIIFTRKSLKEPEAWLRLKEKGLLPKGSILGPYAGLMAEARWRKNLVIGALIASTGVVGLWAIGEYAVDLQKVVFKAHFEKIVPADKVKAEVDWAITISYLLNMLGAAVGMTLFTRLASIGRRFAFLLGFTAALIVTFLVYWKMSSPADAYWMMPLMGMAQLSVFAGFAIYLPELFPSKLRSTGTSFCYNLGRFAAAAGSFFSATLTKDVYGKFATAADASPPLRYSAMTMCAIFLVGIITLAFAPETKGQPLPEDT